MWFPTCVVFVAISLIAGTISAAPAKTSGVPLQLIRSKKECQEVKARVKLPNRTRTVEAKACITQEEYAGGISVQMFESRTVQEDVRTVEVQDGAKK